MVDPCLSAYRRAVILQESGHRIEVERVRALGLKQLGDVVDLRHEMKKKPDLLLVLMFVLGIGMVASGYTFDNPDPELVASQFTIR